jgi:hypothetical protein
VAAMPTTDPLLFRKRDLKFSDFCTMVETPEYSTYSNKWRVTC